MRVYYFRSSCLKNIFFYMAREATFQIWWRWSINVTNLVESWPYGRTPDTGHFKVILYSVQCYAWHWTDNNGHVIAVNVNFKMAAIRHLELSFATLDHPQRLLGDWKRVFKFHVTRSNTFEVIIIWKFRQFGLKRLFPPPKFTLLEAFDPQTLFFIIKFSLLWQQGSVWAKFDWHP